jgi:TolB-like protein/Flp pilus assembly protein TadD
MQQMADVAPLPTSIAVLPFSDVSPSQDQEQFADAISEDVLNVLARNPNLVVIARASAFSFKGKNTDIKSIAARLNVANVLEGSVLRDENQLLVTARLVDANTNSSLWSQTYDLEANDIQLLHNEVAKSVASALGVEQSQSLPVAAPQPAALSHYLRGRHFHGRRAPGDLERAVDQFRSAVEIDPGFTNAWVGLAGALWTYAGERHSDSTAIREEIKHALDRALELDPDHPEANARLAKYYWNIGQDKLAVRHFQRALEFGQNDPQVLGFAAGYAFGQYHYQQALEIQQRAAVLDPLSFVEQVNLALFLRYAGRLDESIAAYKYAFDLNPEAAVDYRQDYLVIYLLKHQYDEAETVALQLPEGPSRDHHLAMIYLAFGQPSRSGEMIERLMADASVDTALRLAEYYAYSGDIELSFHWLDETKKRQADVVIHPATNTYFEVFLHSPFLQQLTEDARWPAWREYLESRIPTPVISINTPQLVVTAQ